MLNIIANTKEGAFKAGVYSLFDAYKYKEIDNNFDNIGELEVLCQIVLVRNNDIM